MTNLQDIFVSKRREVILDKGDMMTVLEVLREVKRNSRIYTLARMEYGCCGVADDPNEWYIHFDATNKQWRIFIAKLHEMDYKLVLKEDGIYLQKE